MALPVAAAATATGLAVGIAKKVMQSLSPQAQRAQQQGQEFESVYLAQVLNGMTSSLGDKTGFDGGHAESQWRTMLNEETAKTISRAGGVGIANAVSRELLRAQEALR